jgi:hypothetical protein
MRIQLRALFLLIGLAVAVRVFAVYDGPAPEEPQKVLEHNRRLLEKWRGDPEHMQRLQADYQAFLALLPDRQARLRKLDKDLHAEDPAMQARLWTVLERYTSWLEKLPEGDRNWIESAPDSAGRLERVKHLRDQQWVKRLPQKIQQELAELAENKRPDRIAELRQEERQRRLEWFWSSHDRDAAALKRARPTRISEFPPEVRYYYYAVLNHILTKAERDRLKDAEGNWPLYAQTLAKAIDTPPRLPGFPEGGSWPVKIQELPNQWRFALNGYLRPDGTGGVKGSLKKTLDPADRAHRRKLLNQLNEKDKWPDFAVLAVKIVRDEKLKVDTQLGPNKPEHFGLPTQNFIKNELLPKLTEAQRTDLTAREGKWPDYPELLLELAKRHGLTVPGMARPCPAEFWDAVNKLLPDVSDRVLRTFALNDLTPDERRDLKLSPEDAAGRERLVEKYWARHSEELKRRLQPPKSKRP